MRKLLPILFGVILFSQYSSSQRILFQSDFENITFQNNDSLPSGWRKLDVDQNNPSQGWAVRDTIQVMGGNPNINRPRAHNSRKSLHICWLAGTGGNKLNDDWVWTDSLRIQTGDSLIWWMLIGSTPGIAPYLDSVQVWVNSAQTPNSTITKLATLKSNDSAGIPLNNNVWTQHKYNLSSFAGQRIYIAFRYYLPVQNALWCNIDDMFIGNHSAIGITPIGNKVPKEFSLSQNYPNPFNPTTKIQFSIPVRTGRDLSIQIKVFDVLGREVATLVNEQLNPGTYETDWSADKFASGVYYYKLVSGTFSDTRKMILIK